VTPKTPPPIAVSGNNPCPFLRALVASGQLSDGTEPLTKVAAVIVETAGAGDGHPGLPAVAIVGIGLVANGIGPLSLIDSTLRGLKLDALRGGPLDKKGVGSAILDAQGEVDLRELARLRKFASAKVGDDGKSELGLALPELRAFMDANYARAAGRRRIIDRALMNGEWPVLLQVMGKECASGRYLSLRDVRTLFTKRRLPARMTRRLRAG